jgi:HAD superfamily hydrolase (TIGR01509 family)
LDVATADGAPPLRAALFDVDGTLVDSERDGHRAAFNAAFVEADLAVHWDVVEYGELLDVTGGDRRIRHYLLRSGYDDEAATRLAKRLHARKNEIFVELVQAGQIAPRPGIRRLLDVLVEAGVRVAVVTTGRSSWVLPLLAKSFPEIPFDPVITGDDVTALKPDPSAYLLALVRLRVPPAQAVAIEDSRNGLIAATAAGLPCVVVANDYTEAHDFTGAALVLDGFGDEALPARVIADPLWTDCRGKLDAVVLRRLRHLANS